VACRAAHGQATLWYLAKLCRALYVRYTCAALQVVKSASRSSLLGSDASGGGGGADLVGTLDKKDADSRGSAAPAAQVTGAIGTLNQRCL